VSAIERFFFCSSDWGSAPGTWPDSRSSDLCFDTATIRVSGKGRRENQLPLARDVGDALLEYVLKEHLV